MNAAVMVRVVGRLVWKEYRVQRSFWLAMFALSVLLQLIIFMLTRDPEPQAGPLFAMAFAMPIFYALGCGGVMFAAEKEDNTWELLQRLPVPPSLLLLSKLVTGVIGVGLMSGGLLLLSYLMAGSDVPQYIGGPTATEYGLVLASFLLITIFFSLLTERVLVAVTWAAVISFFLNFQNFRFELTTNGWYLALHGLLLLGEFALVRAWFLDRPVAKDLEPVWPGYFEAGQAWERAIEQAPAWRRESKRYLWLIARQAFPVMFFWVVGGLILIAISPIIRWSMRADYSYLVIFTTPMVCGVSLFRAEHRHQRYRLLSERGFSPTKYWLYQQAVWFAFTLTLMLLFLTGDCITRVLWRNGLLFDLRFGDVKSGLVDSVLLYGAHFPRSLFEAVSRLVPPSSNRVHELADFFRVQLPLIVSFWGPYTLVCFACGQLASLVFSRSVTAVFLAGVLTSVVLCWDALVVFLSHSVWLWVLPIALVFFAASLLRTHQWFGQRGNARDWLVTVGVVVVPLGVGLTLFCCWRAIQIPETASELPTELYAATPAELETAAMYRQAGDLYVSFRPPSGGEMGESSTDQIESMPEDMDGHAEEFSFGGNQAVAEMSGGFVSSFGEMAAGVTDPRIIQRTKAEQEAEVRRAREKWLADNQPAVDLFLAASRRPSCAFFNPVRTKPTDYMETMARLRLQDVIAVVQQPVKQLLDAGKLDEAFERQLAIIRCGRHVTQQSVCLDQWLTGCDYQSEQFNSLVEWAAHPGQTPERIHAAIAALEEEHALLFPVDRAWTNEKTMLRNAVTDDPEVLVSSFFKADGSYISEFSYLAVKHLPWEKERAVRCFDQEQSSQRVLRNIETTILHPQPGDHQPSSQLNAMGLGYSVYRADSTYPLGALGNGTPFWDTIERNGPCKVAVFDHDIRDIIRFERDRRACLLRMALLAWRAEHGRYPESLLDLVGSEAKTWLYDPTNGQMFDYYPRGVASKLFVDRYSVNRSSNHPAHMPFVFSGGELRCRVVPIITGAGQHRQDIRPWGDFKLYALPSSSQQDQAAADQP